MITKIIHYCWFGEGKMKKINHQSLNSWRKFLPEYKIIKWNENNTTIMNHPYVQHCYVRKYYAFLTDLVRLVVLKEQGGIYLDTDIEFLRLFPDEMLKQECFTGFESIEPTKSGDWVNTAILGCVAGHRFMDECFDYTLQYFEKHKKPPHNTMVATKVLKDSGLDTYGEQKVNGVTLYTKEKFFPYAFGARPDRKLITESTICIHHWQNSWFASMGIKSNDFTLTWDEKILKKIKEIIREAINKLKKLYRKR